MKLLIHDIFAEVFSGLGISANNMIIIEAKGKYAPCIGCFGCWLKTPGYCYIKDGLQHIGAASGQSDEVIIISEIWYGGYSAAVKNAGFVEGRQNEIHLKQYRCWCGRAGVEWGGGLGIGGGVMLRVIFYVLLVDIVRFFFGIALNLSADEALLSGGLVFSLGKDILVWLFLSSGVLACTWLTACAVKRGRSIKNLYTRVMVPSFLFLVISDIFMLIMALLKGKLIFSLFKKDPYAEYRKLKPQE